MQEGGVSNSRYEAQRMPGMGRPVTAARTSGLRVFVRSVRHLRTSCLRIDSSEFEASTLFAIDEERSGDVGITYGGCTENLYAGLI